MAKRGLAENKERQEGKKERKPNQTARHSLSSLSADVVVTDVNVTSLQLYKRIIKKNFDRQRILIDIFQ